MPIIKSTFELLFLFSLLLVSLPFERSLYHNSRERQWDGKNIFGWEYARFGNVKIFFVLATNKGIRGSGLTCYLFLLRPLSFPTPFISVLFTEL